MNAAASSMADGTSQLASPVVEVVGADDAPVRATVSFVQLEQDHALVVVRGAVCEVFLLTLRQHLANLVAAGVRFVVLDLAEVTACPPEQLSRPVDEDLLGCFGLAGFVGSFDELARLERGAGPDERDEVRGVDRAPAVLGGLDELERHRQPRGA
jgi:hypothetical protein